MARLFGTDGVRGIANQELTVGLACALARAATHYLRTERGAMSRPRILVGRDTRASGDMLEAAVVAGVCASGGDAIRVGVMTTPGVAYLVRRLGADGGIMISASHNPAEYNGIKVFSGAGYKLPDRVEEEIEDLVLGGRSIDDILPRPSGAEIGRASELPDGRDMYVEFLKGLAPSGLKGFKVVLDCANGSAHRIAPEVFELLGAEVTVINAVPDGLNINVECGSTHPSALRRAVLDTGSQMGFAYDGDADRCIAVDERGDVVDGDQILAICGIDMLKRGTLRGNTVVATVMSNFGLEMALRPYGGRVKRTSVGDRYVLEEMVASGHNLGGEQSGHVIFLDNATTGDGILTSVMVASIISREGISLSEAASVMARFPQVMVNVRVPQRVEVERSPAVAKAIREAERALYGCGRVVVRPSGTEPLVRVMVEAEEVQKAREFAEMIGEVVRREFNGEV